MPGEVELEAVPTCSRPASHAPRWQPLKDPRPRHQVTTNTLPPHQRSPLFHCSIATAETATTGDGGFTMDFTLDIVSSISQDIEDVARQEALGNFRKARRMYKEALKTHREKFAVYAEYLRLCLDSGDWDFADGTEDFDLPKSNWSDLEYDVVTLFCEERQRRSSGRTGKCWTIAVRLCRQLENTNFLAFDNEQVWGFQDAGSWCLANGELDFRCCGLASVGLLVARIALTR